MLGQAPRRATCRRCRSSCSKLRKVRSLPTIEAVGEGTSSHVAHLGAYVLNAPPPDNLVLDRSPQRETVPAVGRTEQDTSSALKPEHRNEAKNSLRLQSFQFLAAYPFAQ